MQIKIAERDNAAAYAAADKAEQEGRYNDAVKGFTALGDYRDSADRAVAAAEAGRAAAYAAVTPEALRLAAEKIFRPDRLTLVVKGNAKKVDREKLLEILSGLA